MAVPCGRFAPSPTGPLHFGSLVAATGSFLDARTRGGHWQVRMEDLDPPREIPGAADLILQTLERYGFEWDGPVLYQSRRSAAYDAALETLREQHRLYPCGCTRKEIANATLATTPGPAYPGTCRNGLRGRTPRAWRLRVEDEDIGLMDAVQGAFRQSMPREVGDFVLKRADGLFAYQLAVVVDDAAQGVTQVVRGADLLDSTPRQIYLQRCLGLPTPDYAHLPVATNAAGEKLGKQTLAAPLDAAQCTPTLWRALDFLGQRPPAELRADSLATLWQWALAHWDLRAVPARHSIIAS